MRCLRRYFRRYKRIHMENESKQENGERFLLPFEYIIENPKLLEDKACEKIEVK